MDRHTAEAVVCIADIEEVVESLSVRMRLYCRTIRQVLTFRVFDFGEGEAVLKPMDGKLFIRVSAQDMCTLVGIRTLVHVSLSATTTLPDLEWCPTGEELFECSNSARSEGSEVVPTL